ncbi:HYR domain-containing protein [Sanyastnella coralliicola]|uniref:HYR domain-containing protein n=1 Tax=Sanyastnella coralliicola TaxID=3069118 RepID=UPI0027BA6EAC|nr:HYR domain-containing protein [Longitalea sp. SCSIO 12813]
MTTTLKGLILLLLSVASNAVHGQTLQWAFAAQGEGEQTFVDMAYDAEASILYAVGYYVGSAGDVVSTNIADVAFEFNPVAAGSDADAMVVAINDEGELLWMMDISSPGDDKMLTVDLAPEGGILVGGYTSGNATVTGTSIDVAIDDDYNIGNAGATLLRVSEEGQVIWNQHVSDFQDTAVLDIARGDDGWYVLYSSEGFGLTVDDYSFGNNAQFLLRKIDPEGNSIWQSIFGDWWNVFDISQIEDRHPQLAYFEGKLGVVGNFNSYDFAVIDGQNSYSMFYWSIDTLNDLFLLTFSSEGQLLWANRFLHNLNELRGFGLDINCEGVYVTGSIYAGFFNPTDFGGAYIDWGSNDDIFLAKMNLSTGAPEWVNLLVDYGGHQSNHLYDVKCDNHGNPVICGSYSSNIYVNGNIVESGADTEGLTMSFDTDGSLLWSQALSGSGDDRLCSIAHVNDSLSFFGGTGGAGFGSFTDAEVPELHNAVIALIDHPVNGSLLCCSPPEAGVLTVEESEICPGETLYLSYSAENTGRALQFSTNDIIWNTLFTLDGTSIEVPNAQPGKYRVVTDDPACGLFVSNNVVVTHKENAGINPGAGSCRLELWVEADSTAFGVDGTQLEGQSAEIFKLEELAKGESLTPANEMNVESDAVAPIYMPNLINAHAGILFNGDQNLVLSETPITGNRNGLHVLAVLWPDSLEAAAGPLFSMGSQSEGYDLRVDETTIEMNSPSNVSCEPTAHNDQIGPLLVEWVYDTQNQFEAVIVNAKDTLWSNTVGLDKLDAADLGYSIFMNGDAIDGGPFTLGMLAEAYSAGEGFEGVLFELVAYEGVLQGDDLLAVRSSLAMNYGITLDAEVAHGYLASDGTKVLDFSSDEYVQGSAVIGRDDERRFKQWKARSWENGNFLNIEMVDPYTLDNMDYLGITHDGQNGHAIVEWLGMPGARMGRVWKTQNQGVESTVRIEIPDVPANPYTTLIVHSSDPSFATLDRAYCLQSNGSKRFAEIVLNDGDYFSFCVDAPDLNIETTHVSCNGASDGEIVVNVNGDADLYLFSWDELGIDGDAALNLQDLSAGEYTLTVITSSSCISEFDVTVTEPEALVVALQSVTSPSCASADGSATFQITGGTGPYNYSFTQITVADGFNLPAAYSGVAPNSGLITFNNLSAGEYQLNITDANGCSTSAGIELFASDTTAPLVACVVQIDKSTNGACTYTMEDLTSLPSVTDDCSFVVTQSIPVGTELTPGSYAITFTATDDGGNSDSCTSSLVVSDTQAPVFNCPNDQFHFANADCEFVLPDYTLGLSSSSGCDDGSYSQSPGPGTILNYGLHQITITGIDPFGNESECTFQVAVDDIVAPVITCPSDLTVDASAACTYELPDFTVSALVYEPCGSYSITQTPSPGTDLGIGTHTITLEATDLLGNSADCSFEITVNDTTAPNVICPSDAVRSLSNDCTYFVEDFSASLIYIETCGNVTIQQTPAIGVELTAGTHSIELTITDESNNQSVCNFDLTVQDNQAPAVAYNGGFFFEVNEECEFEVPDFTLDALFDDNCGVTLIEQTPVQGSILDIGDHTCTIHVEDAAGNSDQIEWTITVQDTTAPVVICPSDAQRSIAADCAYVLEDFTALVNAEDPCGIQSITQDPSPGLPLDVDVYTIEFTVLDVHGNESTCSFTLDVIDDTAPQIICVEPFTENISGCTYELPDLTNTVGVSDCHSVTVTQSPIAGTLLGMGSHTIEFNVTDSYDNLTTCSTTIEVVFTGTPIMDCPDDQSVVSNAQCLYILEDFTADVVASTGCGSLTITQSPLPGTELSVGTHEITMTATDDYDGMVTCSFQVQVTGASGLSVSCPGNTIRWTAGNCWYTLEDFTDNVSVIESCGSFTISQNPTLGTQLNAGFHTIELLIQDENGNEETCSFELEVEDSESPVISYSGETSFNLSDACEFSTPDFIAIASVEDNCAIQFATQTPTPGTALSAGVHVITIYAEDIYGNAQSYDFDIQVSDEMAPVVDCGDEIVRAISGDCVYLLEDLTSLISAFDNCEIASIDQSIAAGTELTIGEYTINFEITDVNGLSSECSLVLTVVDDSNPILDCPQDMTFEITNCTTVLEDLTDEVIINDCSLVDFSQSILAGEVLHPGVHMIDFVAVDAFDNQSMCTTEITIVATVNPEIECTVLNPVSVDACFYVMPDYTGNVSILESCGDAVSVSQEPAPGTQVTDELIEVTFTIEDLYGTSQCVQELEITYEVELILECQESVIIEAVDPLSCGAELDYTLPSAEFPCAEPVLSQVSGPEIGDFLAPGVYEVVWSAQVAEQELQCTTTIEIKDMVLPEITCPENISSCNPVVTFTAPETSDNCGVAQVERIDELTLESGDSFPIGTSVLQYKVTDIHGNSQVCEFEITVLDAVEVSFSTAEVDVCANAESVDLTELLQTNADQLTWSSNAPSGIYDPAIAGSDEVTIEVALGECGGNASITMNVYALPEVNAGDDLVVCGMNASLEAFTDGAVMEWDMPNEIMTLDGEGTSSPDIETDTYGEFELNLTVTSTMGCVNQDAVLVTFVEAPLPVDLGEDMFLDSPRSFEVPYEYNGVGEMEWEFIDLNASFDGDTFFASAETPGEYMLIVSVSNEPCPTMSDSLRVMVKDFLVPNGFSPDQDGINDEFVIRGLDELGVVSLNVFDKNGNLVYANDHYDNSWDGTDRRGNKLPAATYYAVMEMQGQVHTQFLIIKYE